MPTVETPKVAEAQKTEAQKTEAQKTAPPAGKTGETKKLAKVAGEKAAKKAPAQKNESAEGSSNFKDVPWSKDKVKVFKAVKKLEEATKDQIVKASGVEKAGHYLYHMRPEAGGLIKGERYEGQAGIFYKLTAKGQKIDPDAELKKREDAKNS